MFSMDGSQHQQSLPTVKPLTLRMVLKYLLTSPRMRATILVLSNFFSFLAHQVWDKGRFLAENSVRTIWFGSHILCSTFFLLYIAFRRVWFFRLCLVGAVITYSLSVYQDTRVVLRHAARGNEKSPLMIILNSENMILLGCALIHVATSPNMLKLILFSLFSSMNLLRVLFSELLPPSAFSVTMLDFFKSLEPVLLSLVSYIDFAVLALYIFQLLCGQTLAIYVVIFAYLSLRRMEHSERSRAGLYHLVLGFQKVCHTSVFPTAVGTAADSIKAAFDALVPMNDSDQLFCHSQSNDSASIKTRATSGYYERLSVVDDFE